MLRTILITSLTLFSLTAQAQTATAMKLLTPFAGNKLNQTLQIQTPKPIKGKCLDSLAASRVDAWRCQADNVVYDPCFASPLKKDGPLACFAAPWEKKIVLITPSETLAKTATTITTKLPWALELANNTRCEIMTGATIHIAGMRVNYDCGDNNIVVGEIDKQTPQWRVFYQREGDLSLEQVAVTTAWY